MNDKMKSPVFIIGAPRSGTSIMLRALRSRAGYAGYNEGHLAPLFHKLAAAVEGHRWFARPREDWASMVGYNHLLTIGPEEIRGRVVKMLLEYYQDLAQGRPWVDKTPGLEMLEALPLVAEMFPEAGFIFMKRRGIENVISAQRKFSQPLKRCCDIWSGCMEAWLDIRPLLEGRYVEIEQRDLIIAPERMGQLLGGFLNLSSQTARSLTECFTTERMEQRRPAREMSQMGLDETPWSMTERATFLRLCGPLMKRLGYTLEAHRFEPEGGFSAPLYYQGLSRDILAEGSPRVLVEEFNRGFRVALEEPEGGEAALLLPRVTVHQATSFSARVGYEAPSGSKARVRIGLRLAGREENAEEFGRELSAGTVVDFKESFTALSGAVEVLIAITAEEGKGGAEKAWVKFIEPKLA